MTDSAPASSADAAAPPSPSAPIRNQPTRLSGLFGDIELLVVILLGIVSVATAYTSFQSALYDGMTASAYSQAQNSQTEAESRYLEANQQYIQDTQTWARLTELTVDMDNPDPAIAEAATAKFEALHFVLVDEVFNAAIIWSDEQVSGGGDYVGPFESEEYIAERFGSWSAEDTRSAELAAQADEYNAEGDRLQLTTVLMAITLFLLGVSAVVRGRRTQWILIGVGMGIFLVSLVMVCTVPVVWF